MKGDNNLEFKKDITSNNNFNKLNNLQIQREQIKLKLMKKYNLSSYEAEQLLKKVEKKHKEKNITKIKQNNAPNLKKINDKEHFFNHEYNNKIVELNNDVNNDNQITIQENVKLSREKHQNLHIKSQYDKISSNKKGFKNSFKNPNLLDEGLDINQQQISPNNEKLPKKLNQPQKELSKVDSYKSKNIDSIMSEILPGYNNQIAIKLENVSLTFEVSNEKIDTIKEYFIRTLKHKGNKKIIINALKNITFNIFKGEKVGIIGYNGAGKSTLLKVISGIYVPDEGSVITKGKISPLLSLGAGFDMNYSGRKNIYLNGAVLGHDKEFLDKKIDEIIEFSELGDFIDIPIKNYSSGMLAKLGFSIATTVNPDILIIDEILGVGDVNFQKKSSDKIRSLMDGGATVLLVSHSIPQIRELCDKAIWINDGKLMEIGEVNKVCDHYLRDAEKASNQQLENIQFR